jgi:hypothetical protein
LSDYERSRNAVVQPRTETLSVAPDKFKCDLCTHESMNESSLHVHRFQEHKIQVPTDRLAKLDITTDVEVYRKLQQLDSDFREVFNTSLGTEGVDSLKPHHRKMMLNNELF